MWIVYVLSTLVAVGLLLSMIPVEAVVRAYASQSGQRPGRQPEARVLPQRIGKGNG